MRLIKRIIAITFLLIFVFSPTLYAQWARTYGGSEDDYPSSILQTNDRGYIIFGETESFGLGNRNIWILKFDMWGDIEWQKTYDMENNDHVYSIQQTSDGGYIIGGFAQLYSTGSYILALKISSFGEIEWKYHYSNPDNVHFDPISERPTGRRGAEVRSILESNDGGYIAVCNAWLLESSEKDIWIVKLSSNGDIEWKKIYGKNALDDQAYSIQQTIDGGYIVVGHTESYGAGSSDVLILKLAFDGTIEWQKAYGGNESERAYSISLTSGGGYIVVGQTGSFGAGSIDIWILKINSIGNVEWQKTYGGSQMDTAHSIQETLDGGYIVAGASHSFGAGDGAIWVQKLNILGVIEWQKTYGGDQNEEVSVVQRSFDGGYIVVGHTESYGAGNRDLMILNLFPNGDIGLPCEFTNDTNSEVFVTDITPEDSFFEPKDFEMSIEDIEITARESNAVVYSLCSGQHTLSITTSSGGTSEPPPGTYIYDHAERTSISANPDDGYNFILWSGDVQSSDKSLSITMDSDKSAKANFSENIVADLIEEAKEAPCFIATAAFGSPLHPYVRTLQDFRDKYFLSSRAGRKLVKLYYKYSPHIAELITNHKALRTVVRIWLIPFVALGYSMVHFGPAKTTIMFALIFMPFFFLVWFYRRRNKQLYN